MDKKTLRGVNAIAAGLFFTAVTLYTFVNLNLSMFLIIAFWLLALVIFWLPWYGLILKLDKKEKEIEQLKAELKNTITEPTPKQNN